MSSRAEQKAAARAAREAAERADAGAAARRRRLAQLGGVLALAAIVVVVLVAVSSGGGGAKTAKVTSGSAAPNGDVATKLLGGIPEHGLTLGRATAPVTLVEYNDMQCPVCRSYTENVFPTLASGYVRTGKVQMKMELQAFIGPDSTPAAEAVIAAGLQDKAWIFAEVFYLDQQEENSGYVTDAFIRSVGAAVPGLDVARLMRDMGSAPVKATLAASQKQFSDLGFTGTPTFQFGKRGGPLSVLNWSRLTPSEFTQPIDALLGA